MAYPDPIKTTFNNFVEGFCASTATWVDQQFKATNQIQPKLDTGQHRLRNQLVDEQWRKTKIDCPSYVGGDSTVLQTHTQFSSSPYEDPGTQFSKLVQTTSVADYEVQFQLLATRIYGLSENFLMGHFINGLKDEIQCEVLAARPYSLHHAIGIAKLFEEKVLVAETTTQPSPKISKTLDNAYCVFDEMPRRDKWSKKVLISGYNEDEDCLCFVTNNDQLMYNDKGSETNDVQIMSWSGDDKIDNI